MRIRWIVLSLAIAALPVLVHPGAAKKAPTLPGPTAKIMLLGTFHFKDAGLDDYKPKHDVDILSEARQREVEEVLDRLAGFAPTRIAVELRPDRQDHLDEQYGRYLAAGKGLSSNEIHQLAFRLGRRLGHERLYAVDAAKRYYEPWVDPDEYARKHGQRAVVRSPWYRRYEKIFEYEDELKTRRTLREFLLYLNEEERILRSHGIYLIGSFKAGVGEDYPGVDSKIAWYNRNLRIFANLQRITDRDDERILVIIGSGHLPILRHAVQASPEYELVEVSEHL